MASKRQVSDGGMRSLETNDSTDSLLLSNTN